MWKATNKLNWTHFEPPPILHSLTHPLTHSLTLKQENSKDKVFQLDNQAIKATKSIEMAGDK